MNIMKDLPIKGAELFFLPSAYLVDDPVNNKTYLQYAGHMVDQKNMFLQMCLRFETATKKKLRDADVEFCFWVKHHPEQVISAMNEIEHIAKDVSLIDKMQQIMNGSSIGKQLFVQTVRAWYSKEYFYDYRGIQKIDPDVTFEQILRGLSDGKDIYKLLSISDSMIREAVFKRLKELLGCSYDAVYHLWIAN